MNLREAAEFLGWRREVVRIAIQDGVQLPKSKKLIKLDANPLARDYDIAEDSLDEFIAAFEDEEPGRHPPVSVRRELLVEARHRCAICVQIAPLQYHHIVEFSKLKHHDPKQMIAICGVCHDRIGKGEIDLKAQLEYKRLIQARKAIGLESDATFPIRFSWDDLRDVIEAVHSTVSSEYSLTSGKYDLSYTDIENKNRLNDLGQNYFEMMRDHHEPYFAKVGAFLRDPVNTAIADLYHEITDELRTKIAADRDRFGRFEEMLIQIRDSAGSIPELKSKRSVLNVLLSFMYFQCDIGRKS